MIPELKLWSVGGSSGVEPVSPLSQMDTELHLEEILVANPELIEPGVKLVGRQTKVAGGWLDLLAVDRDGRLAVYELKRGALARDAVTQILDYASALDAMNEDELVKHITDRSGADGVPRIDDFEQWYGETYGGHDLSSLLPPRMVLIGLGVDEAAERMARFVSAGPVDLSVLTFYGFQREGEILLARQMDVSSADGSRPPRPRKTVADKWKYLKDYLKENGYEPLFDRIVGDILERVPSGQELWREPKRTGIGLGLKEPGEGGKWRTYFGVRAGWDGQGVYSVSVLPQAVHWGGEDALGGLRESVDLSKWPHGGGHYLSFKSAEEWDQLSSAVLAFVDAVMQGRNEHRDDKV